MHPHSSGGLFNSEDRLISLPTVKPPMSYYYSKWEEIGLIVSVAIFFLGLGLYMGQVLPIPLPGVHPHYRTVTVINSTTVTIPINITKTVTYTTTTTVGGKIVTVTMTTTYVETTTTTRIVNNTVTKIIVVPTTTTVNNTVTSTSTTTLPYTLTVTTTVVENASVLPPLNITNLNDTITWMKTDYTLSMLGMVNLSLPLGYCEATLWVFPNASAAIIGVWITPVSNVEQYITGPNTEYTLVYTFPKTGIGEFSFPIPVIVWVNPVNDFTYTIGFNTGDWAVNITNYPYNGYITVVMVGFHKSVTWAYQYLNNGTYLMIFTWPKQIPSGYPISLIQNPPGLCLIQVIRVKPGTPDNYILNMTYLGAQYWNWVRSIAQYGKPAPCYIPWEWTYGRLIYFINITEPIGSNWDYYCAPSKGIWYPLKP